MKTHDLIVIGAGVGGVGQILCRHGIELTGKYGREDFSVPSG